MSSVARQARCEESVLDAAAEVISLSALAFSISSPERMALPDCGSGPINLKGK